MSYTIYMYTNYYTRTYTCTYIIVLGVHVRGCERGKRFVRNAEVSGRRMGGKKKKEKTRKKPTECWYIGKIRRFFFSLLFFYFL